MAAFAVSAAPSAADTVIAHEAKPTNIDAYRGRVVWSNYDAKRKAYWLKVSYRGHIRRLPVRPRREPFDVDLGPDARGRTVAVYSRCRSGLGPAYFTIGMFGDPGSGRGCDIYEYRFATQREWRVKLPGMRATSEFFPTIWGRRIAFARIFQRQPGRRSVEPFLYHAELPGGRATQTPGGTRGRYTKDPGVWEGGPGPTGIDLRGGRLAFTWVASFDRCRKREPRNYNESTQPELWVGRLGAHPRRLEHDCWSPDYARKKAIFFMSSPSFDGRRLWYWQPLFNARSDHIRAYDLATGSRYEKSWNGDTEAIARDGGTTYYTRYQNPDDNDATEVVRARAFTTSPVRSGSARRRQRAEDQPRVVLGRPFLQPR